MNNFLDMFKKKKTAFSDYEKNRLESEIEVVAQSKEGIFIKSKTNDEGYFINLIVDKRVINIDGEANKGKVPDYILFLLLINYSYPNQPPVLLAKTNFSTPTLMDGRDLLKEVIPKWNETIRIIDIALKLPNFLSKVINAMGNSFYGMFTIGAMYNLNNFNNMIVSSFTCTVKQYSSDKVKNIYSLDLTSPYYLILSGDAMMLFDKKVSVALKDMIAFDKFLKVPLKEMISFERKKVSTNNIGTLVFWTSFYSITEIQINKIEKNVNFTFFNDEENSELLLTLEIENILLFRDTLVKKMSRLLIKSETTKIMKGQKQEKRLNVKDINAMSIEEIEMNIGLLKAQIETGDIRSYSVNAFTNLCGKAIEYHSFQGDGKDIDFLMMMKEILDKKEVQKVLDDDKTERDKAAKDQDSL